MAKVTIYLGSPEILSKVRTELEASSIPDYVTVYDRLVQAIHAGDEISVKVTHNTVGNWLSSLQDRYGSDRVHIEHVTYRGRLAKLWGIEIPDWVKDNQIREADLLDVEISAQPGRDFENFILEIFFSPWIAQPRFPQFRLGDLIQSIDLDQWKQAATRPLVGDILRRRLSQWVDNSNSDGERLLIHWLEISPSKLKTQLGIFKTLSRYPDDLGRRIVGEQFSNLKDLELDLVGIEVNESVISPVIDFIRVHLEGFVRLPDKQVAVSQLLNQVSGCLEIEFDILQRILRSKEIDVDKELVRLIRSVFSPLQHRPYLDQALADLDLLVRKPAPPAPDPDPEKPWSDDEWLSWAEKSYLPYRFWLEEIGELTEDVNKYAGAYADWLYSRYSEMRLSSNRMIYQALPALREQMADSAPVLVLIVDNFNAKFLRDFTRYMQNAGFYCENPRFYVSMLPSCTEVSKKSLIVGQPEPFSGTAYEKVVEDTWYKALSGRRVRYLPHIRALRGIKQREHDVYFLNYLPIDIAFHQDEEQVGISHAQFARNYLSALARDVRAFAQRIAAEKDLVVILISDHGSTRIPGDAPNIIDPQFYAKRVQDNHHRYVSISDDELNQLPENVHFQCYLFEKNRFGLEENYLAARNYYRFIPTNVSTYIHGGLTPEETLVPVAVFTPLTISPKPLGIVLLSVDYYYERKSEIPIEILNTNAYECCDLTIELRNPNLDVHSKSIARLAPLSQEVLTFEGKFRRSFGKTEKLQVLLDYNFLGQPQRQDIELDVHVKSISEQAFDIKEMFDT
jgi:hypothetical protein